MPKGTDRYPKKARINRSLAHRVPTHERQQKFLAAYLNCGGIVHACAVAGISRNTHLDWVKRDKQYREQFESVENDRIESLEAEAERRARDKSDLLLIFLLKAARPEKYRERYEHTGAGGSPLTVTFGGRYKPR